MQKNRQLASVAGVAVAALAVTMAATPAQARPAQDKEPVGANRVHDFPSPLGDAQRKLREEAVTKLVKGQATTETRGGQQVIRIKGNGKAPKGSQAAKDRFVSYPTEREESILTFLVDFGDRVSPSTGGTAGPVHNQIAAPDRTWDGNATDDNSTYWTQDFNRAHYEDMMFGEDESFKDFYAKLSNGRFLAKGDVADWVKVPYNEARYGSNSFGGSSTYWPFIRDTATAWYDKQKASGKTDAEITAYLRQFDKVDRYDYDGDGNFNEPDGYIDHFQAIHAGEGEEAGGGAQGADAIWSHRWYAYSTNQGKTGPAGNLLGGVPLGSSGSGSVTTRPSRRTEGSVCSHTSSDMTSVCRTSTTPRAATTAPASGRSCPVGRGSTTARPTSGPPPATWVHGRSCSSAGSTTARCRSART